jgi:hypothetical protein
MSQPTPSPFLTPNDGDHHINPLIPRRQRTLSQYEIKYMKKSEI